MAARGSSWPTVRAAKARLSRKRSPGFPTYAWRSCTRKDARPAEFEASASHGKADRSSFSPSEATDAVVDGLIREATGGSLAGALVTAAGPANPARFAARIVALASTFSILRKGAAGDFLIGIGAGDGFGLAACLWAWRLGLPLKGIVLSIGEKGVLGLDPSGRSLINRFDAERPGVIRSLALLQPVDRESALRSRADFAKEGGPTLDLASAMTLVAAERALDAGLRGHVRISRASRGRPRWDFRGVDGGVEKLGSGLRDARVDAEIEAQALRFEARVDSIARFRLHC